jgi:hypothetical protein
MLKLLLEVSGIRIDNFEYGTVPYYRTVLYVLEDAVRTEQLELKRPKSCQLVS